MGIYDRDYMRHGYKRPNSRKKPPKRRSRVSIPLVISSLVLLGIIAIFAVSLHNAEAESEQVGAVIRIDYPLDVNSATFEELLSVPQIGPSTAEQIIKKRPFIQLEELLSIYGIGESKLNIFSEYLIIASPESTLP